MPKDRLLAFSDGVIAIIITIMVLELHAPRDASLDALAASGPKFLSYILSFAYVALYWLNHHHLMFTVERVNAAILWANTLLLFFLSLLPFTTSWLGETLGATYPTVLYGVSLLASAGAYYGLQTVIVRTRSADHVLKRAIGSDWKGVVSLMLYIAGIGLSFQAPWAGQILFVAVALIWLAPDKRIERALAQ